MIITVSDYFAGYPDHPGITDQMRDDAEDLLDRVNAVRAEAAADGVEFQLNPATGTYISGTQNGGWRPLACKIGAPSSAHKVGKGVDSYDPSRRFASWCWAHRDRVQAHGLSMERPEWTPTWVHLQSKAVASGNIAFVPSSDPPLTSLPAAWA